MSKVILIGGKKRTGKNTAEGYIKEYLISQGYSVKTLSFAEPLKEIVAMIFDLSVEEVEYNKNNVTKVWIEYINNHNQAIGQTDFRRVLQKLGTEVRNAYLGKNFWVNIIKDKIIACKADYVIISDWRFVHEADELSKDFDVRTLIINKDTGIVDNHVSETELESYIPHFTVRNEGSLEQFENKIQRICSNF